jgi:hypothetical protein
LAENTGERREERFAMRPIAPIGAGIATAVAIAMIAISGNQASDPVVASEPGGMDAMSIDMNPHGIPANTATSIGSREFCARINENDVLDADEDDIDTLEIDVTTGPDGMPESNPMIAFQFELRYDAAQTHVVGSDTAMLLAAGTDSSIFDITDAIPDVDGRFLSAAMDLNTGLAGNLPEHGPGTLSRLRIESTPDSRTGVHHLFLDRAIHINGLNEASTPNALNHAVVAIDVDCPTTQPPPVLPPTPKPSPTPTPFSPPPPPPPLTDTGSMDAMAIDMNPHGIPANTATSIGSREFCARINENDILDADEDDIDTLEIDVTTGTQGIPTGSAMIAFQTTLLYPSTDLTVVGASVDHMLSAHDGSAVLDISDVVPHSDGEFYSGAVDLTLETAESGPGVLASISIESLADAATGIFDLRIDDAGHVDPNGEAWLPAQHLNAFVAIGTECPTEPPPPVIIATPTPIPTATPPPPIVTPTATPKRISIASSTPTPSTCFVSCAPGPNSSGIGGDEPISLPRGGGQPSTDELPSVLAWLLAGLGVAAGAVWATARVAKR